MLQMLQTLLFPLLKGKSFFSAIEVNIYELKGTKKKSQDFASFKNHFSIDVFSLYSDAICILKREFSGKMHKLVIPFECVIYIR